MTPTNSQQGKTKGFKKLKVILMISAILSGIAATMGIANTSFDFWTNIKPTVSKVPIVKDYIKPDLTLSFNSSYSVRPDIEVQLTFSISRAGYYSIWNKNSAGVIKRIFPSADENILSIPNKDNFKSSEGLKGTKPEAEETIILLWTRDSPQHPQELQYSSEVLFNQYIDTHKNFDFERKTASIQIK